MGRPLSFKCGKLISSIMKRACSLALIVSFICAPLLLAGTDYSQQISTVQSPPDASSLWEVRIGIPGWVPTITGDFGIRRVTNSVDINLLNELGDLDGLFVLSAYVRYKRWEFFGDGFYVDASDTVTVSNLLSATADLSLQTGFAQAFVGYRVINNPAGYLSLFAGARYSYMGGDLQIFDNGDPRFPILRQALGIPNSLRVSGSREWVDPVAGITGKVHVWKPVSLWAKADVGGFDVSSGWSYAINGGVEFQLSRYVWLQTGWAYLKYDDSSTSFSHDIELSGPLLQFGMNF
jgi:hypothetical protein